MHIVSSLSLDEKTLSWQGKTLPSPCIVEDESNGLRALLIDTLDIPVHVWTSAHSAGASIIAVPIPEGEQALYLRAERFMDVRIEGAFAYSVPESAWSLGAVTSSLMEMAQSTQQAPAPAPGGDDQPHFVHLHTHSEYSLLDGLSTIEEMVTSVVNDGGRALGVSDHGNVAAHPELQRICDEADIKPIFGSEVYLVPDRHRRGKKRYYVHDNGIDIEVDPDSISDKSQIIEKSDSREALNEYQHVCLWAKTDEGLRNLWSMSTIGYTEGFYGKPRIDYDVLSRFSEGVIASTGCLRGPLAHPFINGDEQTARENTARLAGIFGDDLYVEIHTNQLPEQIKANEFSLKIAREMGLGIIASVDSHYATPAQKNVHQAWLAIQTDSDLADDSSLFAGGHDYHLATQDEVIAALNYLPAEVVAEAVETTSRVADQCTARITGEPHPPVYSKPSAEHPDPVKRDEERLVDLCLSNWEAKSKGKSYTDDEAVDRFEREMSLLRSRSTCGYFLVVADYVNHAREMGALVGPGRGSGGGSQIAYYCGITGLDSLEHDLLFERFLNEGRNELPDFDVDFPTKWREPLKAYLRERWGQDNVLSIGTVIRLQPKGAFNDAIRVMKHYGVEIQWSEAEELRKAITAAMVPLAGAKLSWPKFVTDHEDLVSRMRANHPEIMGLMETFLGRVKSFGKHAAGVVVSTDKPLTDLPMRTDSEGNLISQFDMDSLGALGYIKFDLLTLRTLDTIQGTLDRIEEDLGHRPDLENFLDEHDDPQVWEHLSAGNTLGVFQVETPTGTRLTQRFRPESVDDLSAIMALVRPGPSRSGLTDSYIARRNGEEPVRYTDPRLERSLGSTYGVPVYQEQVMEIVRDLAGYSLVEADAVRKILGKKQIEKVDEAGRKFIEAAVANDTDRDVAETIWSQLAEFAKYVFNRSHSYGYAVLGHWTAWLMVHYAPYYLAELLTTVDDDRMGEFVTEARRLGYTVAIPDVNLSGVGFGQSGIEVRYGISQIKGIGIPTAQAIVDKAPFESVEDFRARLLVKGSVVNLGHMRTLVHAGAFDSLSPNRRALEMSLEAEATGEGARCVFKDENVVGPGGLPCTFDWANEPDPPKVSKGRGKSKVWEIKPPPKRCTVACRNYTPPPPVDAATVAPYTEDDIRGIEREFFGVWLSSSPFDRIDHEDRAVLHTREEISNGPQGEYVTAAIVAGLRKHMPKSGGSPMYFVTLATETGSVDAVCFSDAYERVRTDLVEGRLVFVSLKKTGRGVQVAGCAGA